MPTTTYTSRRRRRPLSQVPIGKVSVNPNRPVISRSNLPQIPLCHSCDRPISPTGQCGC